MPSTAPRFNLVILLLAAIVAVTPLTIDMYLPAFPAIAETLNTDIALVQVSLSTYLAGFAVSMLIFGPIADVLGRRKMVLFGLSGFALCSIALTYVTDIHTFWALRALQAIAGGAAAVTIPGIIRHIYGEHTAKGMSYVSMIMMIAPLLAPALGSMVMHWFSWWAIFAVLALYAGALLIPAFIWLPEVETREHKGSWFSLFFASYVEVLGNRQAQPFIATSMFASFGFFGYLTAVPVVYMQVFGADEKLFALLFAGNVGSLILANFINSRIVVKIGSRAMLQYSISSAMLSALMLVVVNMLELGLFATFAAIVPLMMSLSLSAVNADALIMIAFPKHTGTATAVIGTLRFGSGALVGPILALAHTQSAMPFSLLMFSATVCMLLILIWAKVKKRREQG